MSYPSIYKHLDAQGATLEKATQEQLNQAFLCAFNDDLPLGMQYVRALVKKLSHSTTGRAMLDLDPSSVEGQQFARLLGPDIPRQILEKYFGVSFGFYNCCKGVVAPTAEGLQLSLREQIECQDPAFVNC